MTQERITSGYLREVYGPTNGLISRLADQMDSDAKRIKALEADRDRLLSIIRECEWQGEAGFWEASCCPVCMAYPDHGHEPDCQLGAALAASREDMK